MYNENISMPEKILAAATCLTGGTIGVLWLIFCAIKRFPISKFLLFNIYQSAFLALSLYVLNVLISMVVGILYIISIIKNIVGIIYMLLFGAPIFLGLSIFEILIYLTFIYLAISALLGKYGKLPWISNIILYQLGRF